MTNKDLISAVAKKTDFVTRDVKTVLDALEEVIIQGVANEEEVKLFHGFSVVGTLKDEHIARNPQNGQDVLVPAKIVVKTKITPTFKNRVNG